MGNSDHRKARIGNVKKNTASVTKGDGKRNHKRKISEVEGEGRAAAAKHLPARPEADVNTSMLMDHMPWLFQLEPGPSWVAPVARMY